MMFVSNDDSTTFKEWDDSQVVDRQLLQAFNGADNSDVVI